MSNSAANIADIMKAAATEGRKRKSYYSFGDEDGLTATVSASGSLLRISRHFPSETRGLCVDHPDMPEPWQVERRLEKLLSWSKNTSSSEGVIGPHIDSFYSSNTPKVDMVNGRWPVFKKSFLDGSEFTLEYVASKGTIYQIFRMRGTSAEPQRPWEITPNLLIRDLDFINGSNSFNEARYHDEEAYSYEIQGNCLLREHDEDGRKAHLCIKAWDEQTSAIFCRPENVDDSSGEPVTEKSPDVPDVSDTASDSSCGTSAYEESFYGGSVVAFPADDNHSTESYPPANEILADKSSSDGRSIRKQFPKSNRERGSSKYPYFVQWKSTATEASVESQAKSKPQTIILSYRLECGSIDEIQPSSDMSWRIVSETCKQLLTPWDMEPWKLVKNDTLDFFFKRNLEYVLSVCSVPVPKESGEKFPPIALTCGDVDGHRVATAASFYAFQILLLALERCRLLHTETTPEDWHCECDTKPTTSYICILKRRVETVCQGHLKWLFERTNKSGKSFEPHYWLDGSPIEGSEHNRYLPERSLVDTPFQLIKAGDFARTMQEKIASENSIKTDTFSLNWHGILHHDSVKAIVNSWTAELKNMDGRGHCAFPRHEKEHERTRSFYLTDHVLIWQALKSAERILAESAEMNDYSSKHVQQKILKRFTATNPMSKKRMIAVRRSPAHTRFLLRSKDSALFRSMELGLFDHPATDKRSTAQPNVNIWQSKIDVWKNTIDCQIWHDDNEDTTWEDPQRFALSIILAHYLKKPINSRSKQDMLKQAITVLFKSTSANGLFPGNLNKLHEPTLYESEIMRDNYWAKVFEIPYVLWKYCSNLEEASSDGEPGPGVADDDTNLKERSLPLQLQFMGQNWTLMKGHGQDAVLKGGERATAYSMKANFPLNNVVDPKNIVELDDEWLYNTPAFFFRKDANPAAVAPKEMDHRGFSGMKIDFPKHSSLKRRAQSDHSSEQTFDTIAELQDFMTEGRTPEKAKKRIWVLDSSHPCNNDACLLTVSTAETTEKKALRDFCRRHESFENFFWEDTMAEWNTWETEFHLSFFTLCPNVEEQEEKISGVPRRRCLILPGLGQREEYTHLTKTVMSFRFEGDFFDRYWTCRLLSADPEERHNFASLVERLSKGLSVNDHDEDGNETSGTHPPIFYMKQRRVLEQDLFAGMLNIMNGNAKEILKEMRKLLRDGKNDLSKRSFQAFRWNFDTADDDHSEAKTGDEHDDPSSNEQQITTSKDTTQLEKLDYKGYLSARQAFQEFQNGMSRVGAHFAENISTIESWLDRERTRQVERPRWTFNDESRYRTRIMKQAAQNDRMIREFKSYYSDISNLIESTTKDLELMRNYLDIMQIDLDVEQKGLELRRSEDIKRFTYVTIVFLPLGFATGMFSMSEAPAGTTLVNMILTAAATLTITLLTLVGYKFADSTRSREELERRWLSFKARLLRLTILRIVLVILSTKLQKAFSQKLSQRNNVHALERHSVYQEEQKRQENKYPRGRGDKNGEERGDESPRGRTGSAEDGQGEGLGERQRESLEVVQADVQTTDGTMSAEKWKWGIILRSFRKRGVGSLEERFQEDVERRVSSDAGTSAEVEGASMTSAQD